MTTFHHYFFTIFLLLPTISFSSSHPQSTHVVEFCVADLTRDPTPFGYPCKDPTSVTVDDFVFPNFATTTPNTSNAAGIADIRATVASFPALNGLNLAISRVDLKPGGVAGLHTHPYSAEMAHVVEGAITAGFITGLVSNSTVYVKKLNKGEVMVIPQGLLHFQYNSGTQDAVVYNTFSKSDPGLQAVSFALFGSSFPSFLVEKTTGISQAEVKKLKALFGGSG